MTQSAEIRSFHTRTYGPAAADPVNRARTRAPYGLTERELTVLGEMVNGLSNRQIAEKLGIAQFTADKHVKAIMSKMVAPSRTGAAVRAIKEQIVS